MIARSRRCRVRPSFAGTSGDRDELPGGFDGDGLRMRLIVPAAHVTVMGTSRPIEIPGE